jgi:signal-transduction protein with cAMP-binding, CBS, and nucleotidyltransferase domain
MRIIGPIATPPHTLEDPLDYLPHSSIIAYKKGQPIYHQNEPSTNLYLIVEGKVKVSFIGENGDQGISLQHQLSSSASTRDTAFSPVTKTAAKRQH